MKNYKILISRIARAAKVLFCGWMMAMTSSCEDFLTILPTDKIVSDDFWMTKEDVDNVAAESYRLMSQWDFLSRVLVWGELRGDNVVEGNLGGNTDMINLLDANLLPTNGYASWAPFYEVINNCNIVLKYAGGVMDKDPDFTLGDYEVICGEMYALRALCHFYLVRTFRDIPLLDYAVVDNTQNLYQRQSDPVAVLDVCLDDLEEAEKLVLKSGNYFGTSQLKNKGRITKDAVRAMRADVLLWKAAFLDQKLKDPDNKEPISKDDIQKCYKECIDYCDIVLQDRLEYWTNNSKTEDNLKTAFEYVTTKSAVPFPIVFAKDADLKKLENRFQQRYGGFAPYGLLFGKSTGALCESIFEIQHTVSAANANYEIPYFYGYADDKNNFKIGLFSASKSLSQASTGVTDNNKLYAKSDFRRVTYIASETGQEKVDKYAIVKYGYSSAAEDRSKLDANKLEDQKKFGTIRYTYWKTNTNGGKNFFSNEQINWIVYRMSDVLLMKAEALALRGDAGDLDLAFQLVDAVYIRSQAGHDYGEGNNILVSPDMADLLKKEDYTTSEAMYELVLRERQREFAFEGKRWYDLVRVALHDNGTDRILKIIERAGNNPENFVEYRMKLATLNSLFFPISEREINVSNDGNGPTLNQNPAYDTTSDIVETKSN